ncbi:DUF7169 domain-containing protein [Streptomyces sp. IBSNAI001]|uniref:DUF7169 domain-containing protein n=1 Tax=Streptomyces sp. IBSNAI001 TaxID=3457499 RepID=UPI003FD58401
MTYSPNHVADGQHLTHLLDRLQRDLNEMRKMVDIYDDAVTMPGRRPDVDPDGTGRRATADPSRPTENIALDGAREALRAELNTGISHVTVATAYVRGATASMDRALSLWEGEDDAAHVTGGCYVRTDRASLHDRADGQPDGAGRTDGPAAPAPL